MRRVFDPLIAATLTARTIKLQKKADRQASVFCVCSFLSSTLLFAGFWKVAEAVQFDTDTTVTCLGAGGPPLWVGLSFCGCKLLRWMQEERAGPPYYHMGSLLLFLVLSFTAFGIVAPVKDLQELQLARQGLEDSAAPGWASINCTEDTDPEGIDVKTDRFTYFALAAEDWRVASANASVLRRVGKGQKYKGKKRKDGQVWGVAPIEYVGPVDGCRTKYPLFAVCVDPWFNKASCGWDNLNHNYGSLMYMRLLSAHDQFSDSDKDMFLGAWVWNPYDPSQKVQLHHENLFEYDSVSYDDAVRMVARKEEEYATFVMAFALAWFGVTVPSLVYVCVQLFNHPEDEHPNLEDAWIEQPLEEPEEPNPAPPSPPLTEIEAPHPLIAPPSRTDKPEPEVRTTPPGVCPLRRAGHRVPSSTSAPLLTSPPVLTEPLAVPEQLSRL